MSQRPVTHTSSVLALLARELDPDAPRGQGPQALARWWARADAASGWSNGCGEPHPGGGYTTRTVEAGSDGSALVDHTDADGAPHRTDGPARVLLGASGGPLSARWVRHGRPHRTDGPCLLSVAFANVRAYFGSLGPGPRFSFAQGPDALAHYLDLLASGHDGVSACAWTIHDAEAGVAAGAALRAAGVDAALALDLARAGVAGVRAVAAVANSRAPASWAAAPGLGSRT